MSTTSLSLAIATSPTNRWAKSSSSSPFQPERAPTALHDSGLRAAVPVSNTYTNGSAGRALSAPAAFPAERVRDMIGVRSDWGADEGLEPGYIEELFNKIIDMNMKIEQRLSREE